MCVWAEGERQQAGVCNSSRHDCVCVAYITSYVGYNEVCGYWKKKVLKDAGAS